MAEKTPNCKFEVYVVVNREERPSVVAITLSELEREVIAVIERHGLILDREHSGVVADFGERFRAVKDLT